MRPRVATGRRECPSPRYWCLSSARISDHLFSPFNPLSPPPVFPPKSPPPSLTSHPCHGTRLKISHTHTHTHTYKINKYIHIYIYSHLYAKTQVHKFAEGGTEALDVFVRVLLTDLVRIHSGGFVHQFHRDRWQFRGEFPSLCRCKLRF